MSSDRAGGMAFEPLKAVIECYFYTECFIDLSWAVLTPRLYGR